MESSLSRGFQVKCLQYANSSEVRSCYKVKLGGAVLGKLEGLCQLCVSPKNGMLQTSFQVQRLGSEVE